MLYGMPFAISIWLHECCSVVPHTIISKEDSEIPCFLNWNTNALHLLYELLMKSMFNDANDKVVLKNIEPTQKEISSFQILKKGDTPNSPAKKKLKKQPKGVDQHTLKSTPPSRAAKISFVKTPIFKPIQSKETVASNRKDISFQSPDLSSFNHEDEDGVVSKKLFEKFRDEVIRIHHPINQLQQLWLILIRILKAHWIKTMNLSMDEADKDTSPHQATPILHPDFDKNFEGTLNTEGVAEIIENTSTTDVEKPKLDEQNNSEVHTHEEVSGEGKAEPNLQHLPDEGDSDCLYLWHDADTLPTGVTGCGQLMVQTVESKKGRRCRAHKMGRVCHYFLNKFFPLELREMKVLEFINLKQGNITVKEYSLKFTQLAKYAPHMVEDSRSRMSKFVLGVSSNVVKEYRTAMLIKEMDISRLMVHAHQIEEAKNREKERENKRARIGSFNFTQHKLEGGNLSQFRQKSSVLAPSPASALVPKFRDGNRDRTPGPKP
ncbi:putative hyoscyamine 6-dioxygenase-like [Capsicum annuum]|nr:putative hyoscyamine 6-dioxygenase-like [Capsicum annuum]